MEALETGISSERILCASLRMTLGNLCRFAVRAELVLRGVEFDKDMMKEILDFPQEAIIRYKSSISLSRSGPMGLEIHIGSSPEIQNSPFFIRTVLQEVFEIIHTLKDVQKERTSPLIIILHSFWLRRLFVKKHFLEFLEQIGLNYKVIKSGELSMSEYVEHAALFSYEQFVAIKKTGFELGTIFIPGGKDPMLAELQESHLSPADMAQIYNRAHGLTSPL